MKWMGSTVMGNTFHLITPVLVCKRVNFTNSQAFCEERFPSAGGLPFGNPVLIHYFNHNISFLEVQTDTDKNIFWS